MSRLASVYRRLRRLVLARRRLLAFLCAAVAVAAGLRSVTAPPPPTVAVLAAAHDLAGGEVLRPGDLVRVELAPTTVPSGAFGSARDILGRTTAAPLRRGEPLTDVRLVSGSLLDGYPGLVAAPVRVGDAGAVRLLRVGDRVDVLAADPQGRAEASVVASDAAVVALPKVSGAISPTVSGGLVLLAVAQGTASSLAAAGVSHYLSVVIKR